MSEYSLAVPPSAEVQSEAFDRAIKLASGLYPHQVEGVAFLLSRRRAILADDMGLGKTRQSIIALKEAAPYGPYLVVCPASVKRNWRREIELVDQSAEVRIVPNDSIPQGSYAGWVIINYDIISKNQADLLKSEWAGLIFDEAHYLKNRRSQRSAVCRNLVESSDNDPVTYCLTGTPLTNRPRDLFPLLQLVRHPASRSFLTFAKRYCAAEKNDYGWVTDGASNLEELAIQLKGVMLRRKKEDVLDLPPKRRQWIDVEVGANIGVAETQRILDVLIGNELSGGGVRVRDRNSQGQKLLGLLSKLRNRLAVAKVKCTEDIVQNIIEQGEKVLVFSGFDAPIEKLRKTFGESCVAITGATPTAKRQKIVDRFQEDETVRVLVANIVAGGVGLNLTAATQVVFNDLDWVPANHWQAEDRAYRIGQSSSVLVTYVCASNTIDDFVKRVLEIKASLVEAVVEGGAFDNAVGNGVLQELESAVSKLSARLTDTQFDTKDPDFLNSVINELRSQYECATPSETISEKPELSDTLLRVLAEALSGPRRESWRVVSNSDPNNSYTILRDGTDFSCSCPGFEYRGTCRHERKLRQALEREQIPAGYSLIS